MKVIGDCRWQFVSQSCLFQNSHCPRGDTRNRVYHLLLELEELSCRGLVQWVWVWAALSRHKNPRAHSPESHCWGCWSSWWGSSLEIGRICTGSGKVVRVVRIARLVLSLMCMGKGCLRWRLDSYFKGLGYHGSQSPKDSWRKDLINV